MPLQQSTASSSRIEALRAKHKSISRKIELEQLSPSINDYRIGELKRQKLKIKEELEGIREAS